MLPLYRKNKTRRQTENKIPIQQSHLKVSISIWTIPFHKSKSMHWPNSNKNRHPWFCCRAFHRNYTLICIHFGIEVGYCCCWIEISVAVLCNAIILWALKKKTNTKKFTPSKDVVITSVNWNKRFRFFFHSPIVCTY